ncbi:NAD(P)-binding protein [Venturia nashicola]|uniref:NAD(P)-binding protein n=1 Tax=Venturia nashicola TaxID=86259 RepID=A0A4Z1P350_9PEZI|nr:NAD(P)-binding protein [Venturia nashicola]TLD27974.1 NAD(P)-binding protein [Venturia nashicola]
MRIAIAGTNNFALLVARFVVTETSHQIVVLARKEQPGLAGQGYPVLVVDYDNQQTLRHAVMGVDTVICTVTGPSGLQLLHASVSQKVRRFVPAEFEGRPGNRSDPDPLDRGNKIIRSWLDHYRSEIESTIFSFGVFYERFGPGGLESHRLGLAAYICKEGDYIVNVRTMRASAPIYDANYGTGISISMISAQDAAHLVVRAIDLRRWPRELYMVGDRMTVLDVCRTVERVRGNTLFSTSWHNLETLRDELRLAQMLGDVARQMRAHDHLETINGRYDIGAPGNLRGFQETRDIVPITFEAWLRAVWANIPIIHLP